MTLSTSTRIVWRERVNAAIDMLNERNDQGCIRILQALLLDPETPRFWRIQAYAVLAKATDDWYDAENYQYAAELLWTTSRHLWPAGHDEEFDQVLGINRTFLDQLAVDMDNDMPDDLRAYRNGTEADEENRAVEGVDEENDTSDEEEWEEGDDPSDFGEGVDMLEFGQDDPPDDIPPYNPGSGITDASFDEFWDEESDDDSSDDQRP